jgi:hypothetical protein
MGVPRKFAWLPSQRHPASEPLGNTGSEEEPTGFDAQHLGDARADPGRGDVVEQCRKRRSVAEHRGDVFEHDARFWKVGDISNQVRVAIRVVHPISLEARRRVIELNLRATNADELGTNTNCGDLEAVCVPDQKFFDPTTGTELVTVHWDFGLTSVDVAFGGTLLTKITDINQLRTSGMGGSTPDGGSLIIKLGFADAFEVTRNGERLTASDVNAFAHTPVSGTLLDGSSAADSKLALDAAGRLVMGGKRVDEHAMGMIRTSGGSASSATKAISSARGWLLFFSIAQTLITVGLGWLTYVVYWVTEKIKAPEFGTDPTAIGTNSTDSISLVSGLMDVIRGFVLIMFLFSAFCAIGSWILWKVADGPAARKAFTISKWVAAVYFVLGALNTVSSLSHPKASSLIGAIIALAIEAAAFQAFRKAQAAIPEE